MRDGISVSRQTKEKLLVLPTQIQACNDLEGYLRVKGDFPSAAIKLKYVDHPIIHAEFIAREIDADPLRQEIETLVDTYSDPILAADHDAALAATSSRKKEDKKIVTTDKEPSEEKEVVEFL